MFKKKFEKLIFYDNPPLKKTLKVPTLLNTVTSYLGTHVLGKNYRFEYALFLVLKNKDQKDQMQSFFIECFYYILMRKLIIVNVDTEENFWC